MELYRIINNVNISDLFFFSALDDHLISAAQAHGIVSRRARVQGKDIRILGPYDTVQNCVRPFYSKRLDRSKETCLLVGNHLSRHIAYWCDGWTLRYGNKPVFVDGPYALNSHYDDEFVYIWAGWVEQPK